MHPYKLAVVCSLPIALGTSILGCASTESTHQDRVCAKPAQNEGGTEAHADISHPELRDQLLDLRERDQAARQALVDLISRQEPQANGGFQIATEDYPIMLAVQEIDKESTAFLKEMVETHGWPTFDMVGEDGGSAAWILAQHADADPQFQARVLEMMQPLVEQGQAHGHDFALLTDRVLSGQGKPQIYGTQFTADENGVQRPGPTADWDSVDERRASVGLPPIAEYAEQIRASYGGEVSTEPMPIED